MTPRQIKLYWDEWRAVSKIVGNTISRHDLHREALGYDKSSRALSNKEFDRILAHFRAINRPADLNAQLRLQQQPEIRARHVIHNLTSTLARHLGGRDQADAYLDALLRDRFGGLAVEDLDLAALRELIITLTARARSLQRRRTAPAKPDPSDPSDPSHHSPILTLAL